MPEFMLIRLAAAIAATNSLRDSSTNLLANVPGLTSGVAARATKGPAGVAAPQVCLGQTEVSAARGNQAKVTTRTSEAIEANSKALNPQHPRGVGLLAQECVNAQPTTRNGRLLNLHDPATIKVRMVVLFYGESPQLPALSAGPRSLVDWQAAGLAVLRKAPTAVLAHKVLRWTGIALPPLDGILTVMTEIRSYPSATPAAREKVAAKLQGSFAPAIGYTNKVQSVDNFPIDTANSGLTVQARPVWLS
jgi:hypothetical protein